MRPARETRRCTVRGLRRRCAALLAVVACGVGAAACGKKGPPLPPYVRIPSAIEKLDARRVGDDAFGTLTVATMNLDKGRPVDVRRVEVYAYTSLTPPPRARFLEGARLVGTFPVVPLPVEPGTEPSTKPAKKPPPPPPAVTGPVGADGALPGAAITIRDALGADDLVPHELPPPAGRRQALVARIGTALAAPIATELRRFYVAIPFSSKGVAGPPSNLVSLSLTQLPERPLAPRASYVTDRITVEWEPAGGFLGFVLDRALPIEPPPSDRFDPTALRGPALVPGNLPPGPTRYNVYREQAPDPMALPVRRVPSPDWATT